MFKKLILRKFQSHEETVLDLVPGVNVIVGTPNSGKTSIIRGLKLLTYNRPLGSIFFSNFVGDSGTTEVSALLDTGQEVRLEKDIRWSKKKEEFLVDKSRYTIDGSEYEGMGTDVPDMVAKALNLEDINFQSQLDKPYMVSQTSGDIARTINRITHLDDVDDWILECTRNVNSYGSQVDSLTKDIEELQSRLDSITGIEDLGKLVNDLRVMSGRMSKVSRDIDLLDKAIEVIAPIDKELCRLRKLLKAEPHVKEALNLLDKCIDVDNQIYDIQEVQEIDGEISKIREYHFKLDKLVSSIPLEDMRDLEYSIKDLRSLVQVDKDLASIRSKLDKAKNEYAAELKRNGRCPVCLTKIGKEEMQRMVEGL